MLDLSFELSQKIGTRELPKLSARHESSVRGLYVAGDLADAPVIKVALNQGFDVVERLFAEDLGGRAPKPIEGAVDVAIIGAGPAGIGAALACEKRGLSYVVLERSRPFDTIQNYPKAKHIFSEPRDFENSTRFPFVDAIKEDLVAEWEAALDAHALVIRQPEEVVDVKRRGELLEVHTIVGSGERVGPAAAPGDKLVVRARRVVLAIGRRGSVNRLQVPGEELPKVSYSLADPMQHAGERVLVVGGGDSAVEAAIALAEAGAEVTISYRQDSFSRAKGENRAKIERLAAAGKLRVLYESKVRSIDLESVAIDTKGEGALTLPNDRVFVLIGTSLPIPFLHKLGVVMEGALTAERAIWIASFALLTYLFYGIKSHRTLFPFGPDDPLGFVHEALRVPVGTYVDGSPRALDGSFYGTVIYSLLILVFGVLAIRKYRSPAQTKRYLSLIVFQLVFLFGIPELLAPLVIERPWRFYGLSVPWPLSIWSLYQTEVVWFVLAAGVAFVGVPLFVRFQGERFCSFLCGCGGLAETLGDRWRHLAPRGRTSQKLEGLGLVVFAAAAVTTGLILGVDVFHFFESPALVSAKAFAQGWYSITVDFWLASVVGVAFYPYLGNRIWCRYFCPLRAYMQVLGRWFGRLQIASNDKCIGCGECTRFCQMGIQVQRFAQRREDLGNHNSACIQCGICVEVCPMNVLTLERAPGATRSHARLPIVTH